MPQGNVVTSQNIFFFYTRLKVFRSSLYQLYKKERAQSVQLDQIKTYVAAEHKDAPFSEDEIMAAIDKMMDANQVMLSDNIVFLV